MQIDFHYYATYAAAYLAGYSHKECMDISYSAFMVDQCSKTLLKKLGADTSAATTMLQLEMMDAGGDIISLQEITAIWSSFHFLPKDLYAQKSKHPKRYMHKYRLICGPDSELVKKTVELAKGSSLQAAGIAMHVLADTWAHAYFAGTPSLVINNVENEVYEITDPDDRSKDRRIVFNHNPASPDDPEKNNYTNSMYVNNENSVMNLGHGRAGHLPDYSFMRYRYMPAWDDYRMMIKDNPRDYHNAFCQMIHALKYLRGLTDSFETGVYDTDAVLPYDERIRQILGRRQLLASDDWKQFAQDLSNEAIEDFDIDKYQGEYLMAAADKRPDTFLGRFIDAASAHKIMVCTQIASSGNPLAGFAGKLKE